MLYWFCVKVTVMPAPASTPFVLSLSKDERG